jgi:hypothetical protein
MGHGRAHAKYLGVLHLTAVLILSLVDDSSETAPTMCSDSDIVIFKSLESALHIHAPSNDDVFGTLIQGDSPNSAASSQVAHKRKNLPLPDPHATLVVLFRVCALISFLDLVFILLVLLSCFRFLPAA